MRIFNLFPWRYVIRRIAHRKGFLDPFEVLARLRRFSQPSEVQEPIELIRAGMVFHARGLVNTKVIQNNLDWIWPYWIVRQFSPGDPSFIPRAFSFSHVNLTHRNWTALGVPGCLELPIVDPRGMVTPHHDDWSVDHWFLPDEGEPLFPSTFPEAEQQLLMGDGHVVETILRRGDIRLTLRSEVVWEGDEPELRTRAMVESPIPGRLVVTARPCNPEGIQFIDRVAFTEDGCRLDVGDTHQLVFSREPESCHTSDYRHGDVLRQVLEGVASHERECSAGLATAAAAFRTEAGEESGIAYSIRIADEPEESILRRAPKPVAREGWDSYLQDWARLEVPNERYRDIFESSKRTLALLSQSDILPGPFTYRRFWFRDACLIGNALLGLGQDKLVRKALDYFPKRQRLDGYFHSQEGEWDSNGQVLWLIDRYEQLTGGSADFLEKGILTRAAKWIDRKRQRTRKADPAHRGLLPAGFSAEHLGPNDYYYWDDFWGVAGLRSAEAVLKRRGLEDEAAEAGRMAEAFERDLVRNLEQLDAGRVGEAIPAAPTRRMDSGAVGSLVADYPLQLLWIPANRIRATADWLADNALYGGGFFQDMIHSGINAYLTLDLAQTFLRHGDPRFHDLVESAARVASPTGKWPEAVHPNTGGGCMGDGEHAWAAAEWCQMMRSLFLLETPEGLEIGKGLPPEWLHQDEPMAYGPTLTPWGRIALRMEKEAGTWHIHLEADWHAEEPALTVCFPEEFAAELHISKSA